MTIDAGTKVKVIRNEDYYANKINIGEIGVTIETSDVPYIEFENGSIIAMCWWQLEIID